MHSVPKNNNRSVSDLDDLLRAGNKFSTIYADPPWQYKNAASRGAASNHYVTMSIEELCALPVARLSKQNAHLHLWVPGNFLFDAKTVMEAWGFRFKSSFVWIKPQLGLGNYWRVSHEFMLLGTRGKLPFSDKGCQSWILERRNKHSQKPETVRRLIESVSPGPYLELFGRQLPENKLWTVFGNEIA